MATPAQTDDVQLLLAQLAKVTSLLRGTVSTITRPSGKQYYSLQLWQGMGNRCQYIPAAKLEAVRQAVANYHDFRQTVDHLSVLLEQRTREDLGLAEPQAPRPPDSKKNSAKTSRPSARRKSSG